MTRVLVRNPASGDGTAAERAAALADEQGVAMRDTAGPGDAVALARDAAAEADQVLACGGDGTVNEVIRGLLEADALDDVELAVVPAGTGNGFAGNIGIESVEHAFDVATKGPVRRLDLGLAGDRPFVESCMGGLVATASDDTPDDLKDRVGSLAYVFQTLADARDYEGRVLTVTAGDGDDPLWTGDALVVLVGNARRFMGRGGQADVEDGRFEVVIVEEAPTIDYLAEGALGTLLHRDAEHLSRLTAEELRISAVDDAMTFSLDGEIVERRELDLTVREGALRVRVGDSYDSSLPAWPE